MKNSTSFIIVRHEKVENPNNIFYGVSRNLEISQQGMIDAQNVGKKLMVAGISIDGVIMSPLDRAKMTAKNILVGMGLQTSRSRRRNHDFSSNEVEVKVDPRLIDVAYPAIEGRPTDAEGFVILPSGERVNLDNIEPFLDETLDNAGARFRSSLMDLANTHPGQTLLVVSHGDPIAAGLKKIKDPDKEISSIQELIESGLYPQKGEMSFLRLDGKGNLDSEIYRNPDAGELKTLIEGNIKGLKER
ncbi:MAG TPA: histidine phosphatase family protein [Patescibacteria group bacterium]